MTTDISHLEQVIEAASALISELEDRAFQDERFSELSMRQVLYLNTIIRMGHPTFSDLARELNVTRPSVTTIVSTLIHKGYVQKVQDHEDLRAYHIILTPKAEEFNLLHKNIHKHLANALAEQLSGQEVEQLSILLDKALQGIL